MSRAPIMPFFTDAYLADCHHLSTEAHGAMLLILLHTWRGGGVALPDDAKMMRIVKITSPRKWKKIREELLPLFDVSGGTWRQGRLERTWDNVIGKVEANSTNGKRGRAVQLSADKKLKKKEAAPANAHDSPGPTINPEPEPISILDSKEDELMLSTSLSSKALEQLQPVLRDASYFMPRGGSRISPSMRPQIEDALHTVEAQLKSVSQERLMQIISRLMLHFPCPTGEKQHRVASDYAQMLREFPEDLLCASYQHVLKNHKYHNLPKIADLIAFMEPEMNHRRTERRKLTILLQQTQAEEHA